MTSSELRHEIETKRPDSRFFSLNNMRFSGDTMKNYGVRGPMEIETRYGKVVAYELYRRKPVKHGVCEAAYFNAITLEQVWVYRED